MCDKKERENTQALIAQNRERKYENERENVNEKENVNKNEKNAKKRTC